MSASFVAFHGTSAANAESIHQEGFRAGTYFAFDVKDAIAFGGRHVFKVNFSGGHFEGIPDGWQFHLRDPYPPTIIESLTAY